MKRCPQCGFEEKKTSYSAGFENFWSSYPRRVGKGAARKVWSKIKPDGLMLGQMLVAIQDQKETDGWKKDNGIYIPHPATWLNQERWLDETQKKRQEPKYDPDRMAAKERELEALRERLYHQRTSA